MFTNRHPLFKLMAILPLLFISAIPILSNTALGVCGTPGGC